MLLLFIFAPNSINFILSALFLLLTNYKSQMTHTPLRTRRTYWKNITKKCGFFIRDEWNHSLIPWKRAISYVFQKFDMLRGESD